MAQGDLHKLLVETRDLMMVDTEWYRVFLNVKPHTYTNSVANVTKQFRDEVGDGVYSAHKETFDPMLKEYVAFLYKRLTTMGVRAYTIVPQPGSNERKFTIDIIPKQIGGVKKRGTPNKQGIFQYDSEGSDPFKRIINEVKREGLRSLLELVNVLLGPTGKDEQGNDVYRTTSTFLDTGHMPLGVAQKQVYSSLSQLQGSIEANPEVSHLVTSSGVLARLKLQSKWVGEASKQTTITVTDESYKQNRSKATKEKDFKNETLEVLNKILSKKSDWADQKGSDSVVDAIRKTLINAAVKKGATGSKVQKINKTPAKAETKVRGISKSDNITDGGMSVKLPKAKARGFDISLIALLNANLPEAVRANMTGARLNNKTGRFSESVKIVNATQTPQGFPSLTYTYQRSPYDVFDPVLGKDPWNIPSRDPKPLIEKSIRDIARDLAIGRFYVRRQ